MIANAIAPDLGNQYFCRQKNNFIHENIMKIPVQSAQLAFRPDRQTNLISGPYDSIDASSLRADTCQQLRLDEDASEQLNLVLQGGPKWNFRIRQLNDNRVIVSRVNKGPAERAGLKVNDELISVNNVPLSNKPRSLLLHDYPEPTSTTTERAPLLGLAVNESQTNKSSNRESTNIYQVGSLGNTFELSKLDFTYQLIKHSSISNKLLLTVKRYLNSTYARASVAATNLSSTPAYLNHEEATKRANLQTSVHYAYKCCECYRDNEGKSVHLRQNLFVLFCKYVFR